MRIVSLKFMSILKGFVRESIRVSEVSIGIKNMQHERHLIHSHPYIFFCPKKINQHV